MLAHDAGRSGATSIEVRPPFERKWYRLFPEEGLMAGVQPVIAGGKVFIGTLAGILHAIDDSTGKDLWSFRAGGPILHAAAAAGGRVFFGSADGKVYALDASTGEPAWTHQSGAAVWNAPAIHDGVVVIGSRDGNLYALDASSGTVRWVAGFRCPILQSPAIDVRTGRVYAGGEDMRVRAVDIKDGRIVWESAKLPGVSLRGYHPVVAPDGSVMVAAQPGISLDDFERVLLAAVREVFGDFASWRHKKDENERLRRENFEVLKRPETYEKQLEAIRRRLDEEPSLQTFFVLDREDGRKRVTAPIVYAESMNGPGAPPLVAAGGRVIVKYQALLRSRYEHYSPFLNVGYLDTKSGRVEPVMDQDRTYGWHDGLLLVHDEQCQLSAGGRVLFNTHQDNVNGLDLETRKGYPFPLCRGIHEPARGEALGIWTRILRGEELPPGKEWLARGTAVYGGGSVIDVPIAIAGDSFYYLPAHEINAGAALIAYRSKPGSSPAQTVEPARDRPTAEPTDDEWKRIESLRWDWDTLGISRLKHVIEALPGNVAGTKAAPLWSQAEEAAARVAEGELDRFIREARRPATPAVEEWAALKVELARHVRDIISRVWQPLVFPAGKHPREAYRFFDEPTGTLLTLAMAYPHLDGPLQAEVRSFGRHLAWPEASAGAARGPRANGEPRSLYDPPPEKLLRVMDEASLDGLERLYPLWLWVHTTGDASGLEARWPSLKPLADLKAGEVVEDCGNARAAGLIAHTRLAWRAKDAAAAEKSLAAARESLRRRLIYELAHLRGGLIVEVPVGRSVFGRWRNLTPEVARLAASFAPEVHRSLFDVSVRLHRPTWWLAWNVETMMRNECPLELPSASLEVFSALALILGEPAEELRKRLDLPWCSADEFYVRKIALTLDAAAHIDRSAEWVRVAP